MVTEYGYDVFFTITAVCLAVGIGSYFLIENALLKTGIISLLIVVFIFTLNFFRDPDRITPPGENLILSPADGTVIKIEKVTEDRYMKSDAMMISIFMSPVNVHVNRYPISGVIVYFEHIKGEFFAAWDDKASLKNEQTHIGIENKFGKIFFKQIAGFVARRIVAPITVGDTVEIGKRFGMIKFGSRVDIYFPLSSEVKVTLQQKTTAGETILAVMK